MEPCEIVKLYSKISASPSDAQKTNRYIRVNLGSYTVVVDKVGGEQLGREGEKGQGKWCKSKEQRKRRDKGRDGQEP